MLRNLSAKIKAIQVLAPQTITADTLSASVDCEAFGSAAFIVDVGTFSFTGSNKCAIALKVSDDNSTFVDAAAEDLYVVDGAAPVVKLLDATGEDAQAYVIEYRGAHRYVKLNLDISGTVSIPVAVTALLGYSELLPAL